jgi:hypothetical protein
MTSPLWSHKQLPEGAIAKTSPAGSPIEAASSNSDTSMQAHPTPDSERLFSSAGVEVQRERSRGVPPSRHTRNMSVNGALSIAAVLLLLPFMVLTVVGSRRRGQAWIFAIASGLLFALAWAAWYLRDGRSMPPIEQPIWTRGHRGRSLEDSQ